MAKSLLYSEDSTMNLPPGCAIGERVEVPVSLRKDGRVYRFVLRDKLVPEDLLLVMTKAAAFAISEGEPYVGTPPARSVRDFLLKQDVVV